MLLIDGVVLEVVEWPDQMVRFQNKHAVGRQHLADALDDRVYVFDVCAKQFAAVTTLTGPWVSRTSRPTSLEK